MEAKPSRFQKLRDKISKQEKHWEGHEIEWAVLAIISLVAADIEFFLFGFGIFWLPCIFMIFSRLGLVFVPVAIIYIIISFAWGLREMPKHAKSLRLILLTIIIAWTTSILIFKHPLYMRDLGIRLNIARTGGAEQLQTWVEDILERPPPEVVSDPNRESWSPIKPELLSDQVKSISGSNLVILRKEGQEKYVNIIVGGAREWKAWGIIVSSPQTRVEDIVEMRLCKWRDGLYTY